MQDTLEVMVKQFIKQNGDKWGNDSYSAGYLGGLVVQLGKDDKRLKKLLEAWFDLELNGVK